MAHDVELSLPPCLLAICILAFGKYLFISLAHLLIGSFACFDSFYILDMNPLWEAATMISPFCRLSLAVSIAGQQPFSFIKAQPHSCCLYSLSD